LICFQQIKFPYSCVKYRAAFPRVCFDHVNSKNN